jgi:hypothetical protein
MAILGIFIYAVIGAVVVRYAYYISNEATSESWCI